MQQQTNDASGVLTMMQASTQRPVSSQGLYWYAVGNKWSNLPEGFEDFWVDTLVFRQCDDGEFAFWGSSIEKQWACRRVRIPDEKYYQMWIFVFGSLYAMQWVALLHLARKRSWGLYLTTLCGNIQMQSKLVGSAFQPSLPLL
jgi:hypothetical protein